MSLIFVMIATELFGYSDTAAGTLYGLWGVGLSMYQLAFGFIIDALGVKRSFILSCILTAIGRAALAVSYTKTTFLLAMFGPATAGASLGSAVVIIGVKRYTHEVNRGFAFSLYYTSLNAAALLNGLLLDPFRVTLSHGLHWSSWGPNAVVNSGYRLYLALGAVTGLLGIAVALCLRIGVVVPSVASPKRTKSDFITADQQPLAPDMHRMTADPEVLTEALKAAVVADAEDEEHARLVIMTSPFAGLPAPDGAPLQLAVGGGWRRAVARFQTEVQELLASREFWKFLAMCVVTIWLKTIFRHLDATLPKAQVRSFGCSAHIGLIYSINPLVILTLVPIVGAMTSHYEHFDMIHYGSYLSALSPFWLAAFQREWAAALFVLQLSIGEAIWSPRWYDYSMSVAPAGREGAFGAFAAAPLFLGKFFTGALGGVLLQRFCPDNGVRCEGGETPPPIPTAVTCDGNDLWGIIGVLTCISPLCILIFQKYLRPAPPWIPEEDQDLDTGHIFMAPVHPDSPTVQIAQHVAPAHQTALEHQLSAIDRVRAEDL
eukprot:jgi/Astpho2/4505/fgenesh1_pg.00067_%23_79_t